MPSSARRTASPSRTTAARTTAERVSPTPAATSSSRSLISSDVNLVGTGIMRNIMRIVEHQLSPTRSGSFSICTETPAAGAGRQTGCARRSSVFEQAPSHRLSQRRGTPNGIRTRVTALKGRRPWPLDDGGPTDRGFRRLPASPPMAVSTPGASLLLRRSGRPAPGAPPSLQALSHVALSLLALLGRLPGMKLPAGRLRAIAELYPQGFEGISHPVGLLEASRGACSGADFE